MQTRFKRLANSQDLRSLTVRMPAEVKEPLRDAAKKRNVSVANLLTAIVARDLGIEGYELPEPHKEF
ncbi:hypothetical protein AB0O14_19050 [Microbacterium foliorum]